MGSKKRSAESVEDEEGRLDSESNEVVLSKKLKKKTKNEKGKNVSMASEEAIPSSVEPMESNEVVLSDKLKKKKKKPKKEKGKDESTAGEEETGPSATPSSVKPMERKKKRKAMDKVRKASGVENVEPKALKIEVEKEKENDNVAGPSTGGALPEFHIGVFKDLGSSDGAVREAAAEKLVAELREVQRAYERLENKEAVEGGLKLEAEKDDGLNQCAPSLRYAVRRLIRGVSSSRECARQGFALGLTLLFATIPSIKVDPLLKLIAELLETTSSMKGQEARECFLGRLFAYGAVARSGRLAEEWNSDKNSSYIKEFISLIISLAAKKRYLQEPAMTVVLDLTEKLPHEALLNHVLEAPGLGDWFAGAENPDALLLALRIREKAGVDHAVFGQLLPNPFCPNKLFSAEHLSTLAASLKESGFCQPRVHSVWPVLVNILLPDNLMQKDDASSVSSALKKHKKNRKSSSSEEEIAKNLQCFIEVIIEGSLLVSSHDRKHLALDILLLLLPRLPASFIPIVLSYKLVQCLIDIMSTKDSWLFKVGQHFLKELADWAKNDDVKKVAIIVALQKHSNGKFDCITRTKTVKSFTVDFETESGCLLFIQNLQDMFVDESQPSEEPSDQSQTTDDNTETPSVEEKDAIGVTGNSDFLKTWIVESLPTISKCSKLDLDSKFRVQKEILKFLAIQGVFSASLGSEVTSFELQEKFRWPKVATSSSLCKICIEQLQLLLANAQKGEGARALLNSAEPNDLGSYFMRFLNTLRNIPSISLFRPLEDDEEKIFKKLQAMETFLSKEEKVCGTGKSDANRPHSLRYLLIQVLLQMLLRPREFSETASELIICCKKAFPSPDHADSSDDDDDEKEKDDDAPAVMDVLVDTLLSLLPQSSSPLRTAIEQVFKYFCDDITDDGLLQMLRIVKKSLKPARHQVAESDNDEEDEEEDEDFLNIEEEEEGIDKDENTDMGEGEGQTDDSEAIDEPQEAPKEDSDDESDDGMDDDAMFKMDTYLAQIFKERKNLAGSETAQSQLVLFKLRVLSLLEIYLHENPGKSQVLLVYSHLARTLVSPQAAESSEQLVQRIWGIVQKKIFRAKVPPKVVYENLQTLESFLQKSLKLASKALKKKKLANKKQSASFNRQKMIASLAQNSTYWILKIVESMNLPKSELQRVHDIFQTVMAQYFDSKKSQIKTEFLKEIFRRRPYIGHHLLGFLLEKLGTTKSEFRRIEALDLVTEILKSLGSDKDVLKETLTSHMSKLSCLIGVLVTNKPEKSSRRGEARKFCNKIFQTLSSLDLAKPFVKVLDENALALCESQFGDQFTNLKKLC